MAEYLQPIPVFFLLSGLATWFVVMIASIHVARDYKYAQEQRIYAEHVWQRIHNEHLAIQRLMENAHGSEANEINGRRDSYYQSIS